MIIKILKTLALAISLIACEADKNNTAQTDPNDDKIWRYIDRYIFLPKGIAVTPDIQLANEITIEGLKDLENNTDLGPGYFIVDYAEASLLYPITSDTSYYGRNWKSFVQAWEDELYNSTAAEGIGVSPDEDITVAYNSLNIQQYWAIIRLSCFNAGIACGRPNQAQSKIFVLRTFGYLIGLRFGENASSAVMRAGVNSLMTDDAELKRFYAEFDNRLEEIRNAIPVP